MPPGPPPTTQQVVCSESRMDSEVSDFERGITSGAKDPPNLSGSRQQIYTAQQIGSRHADLGGGDHFPALADHHRLSAAQPISGVSFL